MLGRVSGRSHSFTSSLSSTCFTALRHVHIISQCIIVDRNNSSLGQWRCDFLTVHLRRRWRIYDGTLPNNGIGDRPIAGRSSAQSLQDRDALKFRGAVASVYSVARSSSASDWSQFCNGRTDESAHSQHQVHFHSLGHEITLIIAKPINQWSLIDEKEETQNTFATKNQSVKSVKTDKMSNDDLCTSFRHSASACSSCYACSCDQSAVL